jgi:hypothetical protein
MTDAAQEIDILRAVKSAPATALHGADLRESALPEAQHMLGHMEGFSDFADRAKGFRGLFRSKCDFFRLANKFRH